MVGCLTQRQDYLDGPGHQGNRRRILNEFAVVPTGHVVAVSAPWAGRGGVAKWATYRHKWPQGGTTWPCARDVAIELLPPESAALEPQAIPRHRAHTAASFHPVATCDER